MADLNKTFGAFTLPRHKKTIVEHSTVRREVA